MGIFAGKPSQPPEELEAEYVRMRAEEEERRALEEAERDGGIADPPAGFRHWLRRVFRRKPQ